MNRREFLQRAPLGVGLVTASQLAEQSTRRLELRSYRLRQGPQVRRFDEWMKASLLLMKKHSINPVGFFTVVIGVMPTVVGLFTFDSLVEKERAEGGLGADPEWKKLSDQFGAAEEPPYEYVDVALLRATSYCPKISSLAEAKGSGRIFELRTYRFATERQMRANDRLFSDHIVPLFRRHGFGQVFFGEPLAGFESPGFTYMLAFTTWSEREKAWSSFGADPEWAQARDESLRASGYIVTSITNSLLRSAEYSAI